MNSEFSKLTTVNPLALSVAKTQFLASLSAGVLASLSAIRLRWPSKTYQAAVISPQSIGIMPFTHNTYA